MSLFNRRRYVQQEIWDKSMLPLVGGVALFTLAVSCMFLTVGFLSQIPFLLYTPLLGALLLVMGAYYETHAVPRAVTLWIVVVITAVTGLLVAIGTANANESRLGPNLLICAGLLLIPLAAAVYATLQATIQYRQSVAGALDQILIDMVQVRGEVTVDELAEELKIGPSLVIAKAEQAIADGKLAGVVDPENERVYSVSTIAQKQKQLGSIIQARGQATTQELSEALKAPENLIRRWLYQLVRLGHFSGYVDWETHTVYSRQRASLTGQELCPNCAATLKLVGQGVIGCQFCGAEIFI